ncbi:MAG: 50S ribosomal protein L9 [Bacillati bacterium ANGP1]|uniref:Large ribosomal subunit protein bL9 n=1 Tax=Candidatus Segetimicrobium genomatis TaxID=2569760 RepID=A0A537JHR5_9BACT|nr:MAG: 50S ribosomal protein L9 [Terrabacteria group bacterium ANGP1]
MKVILLQDVPTLGRTGEVREVKDGYAAHYLLPRGLAARATTGTLQSLQQTIRVSQARDARTLEQTAALKSRLEALVVEVTAKAGEGGRLFGSVTAQDIAEAITQKGVEVSKKQVELQDPIKAAGFYRIPVRIHPKVSAMVEVNVVGAG